MNRFHVFYSAMSEMASGFRPVEAVDVDKAEPLAQCEFPSAVTASVRNRALYGVC